MTDSAGHPVLGAEPMIGYFDCLSCNLQGKDQGACELIGSEQSSFDESIDDVCTPTSSLRDSCNRPCHYYIEISNGDDSTY